MLRSFPCLLALLSAPLWAAEFHVSPQGDDAAAGTEAAPFATLEQARDAVRLTRQTKPEEGVTVWVHQGDYIMGAGLKLGTEDGGTADVPVIYRAVAQESPRLLGGLVLPAEIFQPVTDAAIRARLDEAAQDTVLVADLRALGAEDLGVFPENFTDPPVLPELFFAGARMTLAQWPNEGWAEVARVVESGPAPWRNHESPVPVGTFAYDGDRPARWKDTQVWLQGYWCFDWASDTILAGKIDTEKQEITLAHPHHYGLGSGNPAPRRYRALNLLEELDAPGEYYIDRENHLLYFWPPAPLTNTEVILSMLPEPLIEIEDAQHLILQGLTLEMPRAVAVRVRGGEHVSLRECTVRNTGLQGIDIAGGTGHTVDSCTIHDTGTDGLLIGGGDRRTLAPSGHAVVNNHIHHISRRRPTAAYHVQLRGVGVRLAHNELHDAPHQSILLGGNDHVIEYNEVYEIARFSDDCGAFYMGRNPSERGNVIRYNYWHDIGSDFAHGSAAVYFDDGTSGQHVYGNVFHRASGGSFGAVFLHGGHDNLVENNVFIECSRAVGHAPWNDAGWKEWVEGELWHTRLREEVDITQPPYTERYPALRGFYDLPGPPRVNHMRNNLVFRCGDLKTGNWELENNWVTEEDPGFVNLEKKDFRLRPDAPVFQQIPGFQAPPLERMGRGR